MIELTQTELQYIAGGDAISNAGTGATVGGLFGTLGGASVGALVVILTASGPVGWVALGIGIGGGALTGAGIGGAAGGLWGFLS